MGGCEGVGEYSDLGNCGWSHVVVVAGAPLRIGGFNPWDESNKWGDQVGTVRIEGIEHPVPVYVIKFQGTEFRMAANEVSNNVWVFGCNDLPITTTIPE
jgi:hypothetical protein